MAKPAGKSKAEKFSNLAENYHNEKLELKIGGIRAKIQDSGNMKIHYGPATISFTPSEAEQLAAWINNVYGEENE